MNMEYVKELLVLLIGSSLVSNVVLSQFLGLCPFLGVSRKTNTAAGMGAAVISPALAEMDTASPVSNRNVIVNIGVSLLCQQDFVSTAQYICPAPPCQDRHFLQNPVDTVLHACYQWTLQAGARPPVHCCGSTIGRTPPFGQPDHPMSPVRQSFHPLKQKWNHIAAYSLQQIGRAHV